MGMLWAIHRRHPRIERESHCRSQLPLLRWGTWEEASPNGACSTRHQAQPCSPFVLKQRYFPTRMNQQTPEGDVIYEDGYGCRALALTRKFRVRALRVHMAWVNEGGVSVQASFLPLFEVMCKAIDEDAYADDKARGDSASSCGKRDAVACARCVCHDER